MPTFKRQPASSEDRKYFTEVNDALEVDDLIRLQRKSYSWFLKEGIQQLFEEVSPIEDFSGRDLELYFEDYTIDEVNYSEQKCRDRNLSHEAPLRAKVRFVNKKTEEEVKQEIYLGDIPVITSRGTFIINGVERAVVSQIIRSPGAFFSAEEIRGRNYYGGKIIPDRGAWIELETDKRNVLWVKVDRKRKVPVTSLLKAFGYESDEEIKELFEGVNTHSNIDYVENTLEKDKAENMEEGLIEVYKRIRPGDLATPENAQELIENMFFNFDRYDFGKVGVYKLNNKFDLGLDEEDFDKEDNRTMSREVFVHVVREIIRLNVEQEAPDDIDHLGNRRIRPVGELVKNRLRVGISRMERIAKDRMSTNDLDELKPNKLINAKPIIGVMREFFMSSRLSHFMDQTNPLAELEHKRRISALGPGGLNRDRAGFEVRDVHTTHYGRICPIATPEGQNIGLSLHLASYAKVNKFGFLETPYRKVVTEVPNEARFTKEERLREDISDIGSKEDKITEEIAEELAKLDREEIKVQPRVTDEIVYLDAFEEEKITTVSSTIDTNDDGYIQEERVAARVEGEPEETKAVDIDFMDVASNQILSMGSSLIPFLEHDDATRALMGTNMQRQAMPCIKNDAPLVGTGEEEKAAKDSGHMKIAPADGEIIDVKADEVTMETEDGSEITYELTKFERSNEASCLNQHPVVEEGEKVEKGDALTDGPCIDKNGELAVGTNALTAYMVWEGYNYEDALIVSERLVQSDQYTSIQMEEYETEIEDTKLGPEEITGDIPNVPESKLQKLNSDGLIRIGAEVDSNDILVGKVTPKGKKEFTPEEKLLQAIFGEKAKNVKNSSLYMQHGESGKVVDVNVFDSSDEDTDLQPGVEKHVEVTVADMRKLKVGDKMAGRHGNKGVISKVVPTEDMPFLEDGTPVDLILSPLSVISRMNIGQLLETQLGLAANAKGYRAASPVLNGIDEETIEEELEDAGLPADARLQLYDGKTGEAFDNKTLVGYSYRLKLEHMIDDKMHQRSVGPYSLITQQPLGGKAQFGGQRLGEMEVWAVEAYGAAHMLQEMLTIKSDDVKGRSDAYESIIKGDPITRINLPESFSVLVRELKGLCLDVELLQRTKEGDYVRLEDIEEEQQEEEE
jgi:DNA-directed RNA polymerase subunit beta